MAVPPALPEGASADDDAGWYSFNDVDPDSFAASIGPIKFRQVSDGCGQVRMMPTEKMLNLGGSVHGGAVMTFIDMALFAGGRIAGMERGHYVTLDCATHFIARSVADSPLDAFVRMVGQTKGGHVFLSGHCEQDGKTVQSFNGTLKRIRERT